MVRLVTGYALHYMGHISLRGQVPAGFNFVLFPDSSVGWMYPEYGAFEITLTATIPFTYEYYVNMIKC